MQYTEPTIFSALEEGTFSFALGISPWLFGLLVFTIYFLVWATYLKTTRTISVPWKIFFVATRGSVLVLILFCLLRPVVTTIQTSPQETYLGILIDDSQSMSIGDLDGGQTRASGVENALFNDGLIENLSESFQIRTFRFDGETQRIAGVDDLIEEGMASSIDQALNYVDDQLSGLRLGGLILLSDGADNSSDTDPLVTAQDLGARKIPIFTVGVGQESIPQGYRDSRC